MSEILPPCEKCGSREYEVSWKGSSYAFRCARCHAGWCATTRIPPIRADLGPYVVIVTSLGPNPTEALIALNRRFGHGIRRTRDLFSEGERVLFTGNAYAVWQEAQRLLSEQIPFRIEPEYPYDLVSYDPEHAHEHDWLPVSSSEV